MEIPRTCCQSAKLWRKYICWTTHWSKLYEGTGTNSGTTGQK